MAWLLRRVRLVPQPEMKVSETSTYACRLCSSGHGEQAGRVPRSSKSEGGDLPVGLFCKSPVQPHLQKYFCSGLTQITSISLTVPSHRGADRASSRTRGGMNLVSGQLACKMIGA